MYKPQSPDTSEAADRIQFEILRNMTPEERGRLMTELTLAAQRLGRDTVRKVYGRVPGEE